MQKNKAKKLGSWTHDKSGITVDYFINGTRFECTVLEEKLDAPEAAVLRHKAMDKLEHWMTMEWFPIMEVEVSDDGQHSYSDEPEGDAISIKVKRYWLSRSPAGRVVRCDWDVDEEHRKAQMASYGGSDLQLTRLPLKAPFRGSGRYGRTDGVMIDYTEELWDTVQRMIKALSQMRSELAKLFKNKDGIAKLQAGGSRFLLGEGKKK